MGHTRSLAIVLLAAGLARAELPDTALDKPPAPDSKVAVADTPFTRTLRSASLEDLIARKLDPSGVYTGSPRVREKLDWYQTHFYDTLGAKKVWHIDPAKHELLGPIEWDIVPVPDYDPPPCDQPQPTGYDAEGCRIAASLFKDLERTDPEKARRLREQVRRGRDVWFKGTFGNQDLNNIHLARTTGPVNYEPWMDTRERKRRFTKWGFINDPDCVEGNEQSDWMDVCADPHSSGVLGYRKYYADPSPGFDPKTSPYQKGELAQQKRFVIGHPCVQCHVGFDPTNPPENPNEPKWANIDGLIGNQYVNQPLAAFLAGLPEDHFARQVVKGARPGTVDTSLNPNDFQYNPGTQNNIMDFINRRVFVDRMKDPFTGEIKEGRTQHVLKGGEDSVGDRLALLRVYVNIGMCTEECWVPHFPVAGTFFGEHSHQTPFSIQQCAQDCEAWNYADAKMDDLASFLITGGPSYLMKAKDVDGTSGASLIDAKLVPQGRKVFVRECARCHSSVVAPEAVRGDKDALARFYEGHVFGNEDYWESEFAPDARQSADFQKKFLVIDKTTGKLRPKQFAGEKGMFGQDWLGNDEPTPYNVIGTHKCRALHDNHSKGHVWEEFASETYRQRPSPGSEPKIVSRMLPVVGGKEWGRETIEGGRGYLRNISLLSVWATAPFLHNNAIGPLVPLGDGAIDYTVRGRVKMFEAAIGELLTSDNPKVTPHREPVITRADRDFKLSNQEDGKGWITLSVKKGTPVFHFASSDPHAPLFMKCDDDVENKGHQFGVDLKPDEKKALAEFLKLM
jgi:hypothetical protein